MGGLACEALIGGSRVSEFAEGEWEALPAFQRIGIRKVSIIWDPMAALIDPNLSVDLIRTLAHAATDIGLPVKSLPLWEYKGPSVDEIWLDYQGERGQEMFSQGRRE